MAKARLVEVVLRFKTEAPLSEVRQWGFDPRGGFWGEQKADTTVVAARNVDPRPSPTGRTVRGKL